MKKVEIKKIIREILGRVKWLEEEVKNLDFSKEKESDTENKRVGIKEVSMEFPIDKVGWIQESDLISEHYYMTLNGAFNRLTGKEVDIYKVLDKGSFYKVRVRIDKI